MAYSPKNQAALPISGSTVGSTPPSTAFLGGVYSANTSLPTPQSSPSGLLIGALGDKFGRLVILNNGPRDMTGGLNGSSSTNITSINTFSAVTPVPGASSYYDISSIVIQNNSSSATGVLLSDSNGIGGSSANTYTYSTAQSFNWTAPIGTTSVTVQAWGGGGGGANGGYVYGGGGGAYASSVVSVTPGTTYLVTIGGAGSGGAASTYNGPNNVGNAGGNSLFSNSTGTTNYVLAAGGAGGGASAGGAGGSTSASIGTYLASGGAGGPGLASGTYDRLGGGGGSSGGYSGSISSQTPITGNTSTNNIGGTAVSNGGAGGNDNALASSFNGVNPGGGGAGGSFEGGNGAYNKTLKDAGADGAAGKISLTYTQLGNSYYFQVPAYATRGANYTVPLISTQPNTAWYLESLNSNNINVSITYILNKG